MTRALGCYAVLRSLRPCRSLGGSAQAFLELLALALQRVHSSTQLFHVAFVVLGSLLGLLVIVQANLLTRTENVFSRRWLSAKSHDTELMGAKTVCPKVETVSFTYSATSRSESNCARAAGNSAIFPARYETWIRRKWVPSQQLAFSHLRRSLGERR
jgi:hypothetical protein